MTVNFLRYATTVVVGVMILMTGPFAVEARPLKKENCDALVSERKELAGFGAERAIVKGPEWARANMPPKILEYVHRYLIVEEMLLFRCKGVKVPDLVLQQASVMSVGKKKQKKPPATQGIVPPPPLPKIKPVTTQTKPAKNEALAAAQKKNKPEQAKTKVTAAESIKTAAIPVKAKTPAAAASEAADANPAVAAMPLPDRKPTPAERTAYAKAIAEAARRAAALKKKRNDALRVTTPDIQQLLLSTENN